MTVEQILAALAERKGSGRWGIGNAAVYLKRLPVETLGVDPEQWAKAVRKAENQLTFCAPDMLPVKARRKTTEGSVMEFDAVVTSNRIDRDGDILEAKGARVDERSPLLWQHSHMHLIGKLIKVTGQNTKRVTARFAIANTPLGQEVAELVKFGALRISHGFNPEEYEERKAKKNDDDEDGEFLGWHITKYEIMEVSLVSVPSNTDAIITAIEDAKLHDPAVKAMIEQWRKDQARTTMLIDVGSGKKVEVDALIRDVKPAGVDSAGSGEQRPLLTEAQKELLQAGIQDFYKKPVPAKSYYGPLDGSWEWVTATLRDSALDYLRSQSVPIPRDDPWVNVVATYADYAVTLLCSRNSEERAYRLQWKLADKKPAWTGKPEEVEVTIEIRGKAAGYSRLKSGRVLSKANESKIVDARDNCEAIVGIDDVPRAATSLARESVAKLDSVLETVADEEEDKRPMGLTLPKALATATREQLEAEVDLRDAEEFTAVLDQLE